MQHDMDVGGGGGAGVRADFNGALQALATASSGATAPTTTYPYQFWADTTAGVLRQRNAANTAWIVRAPLAETLVVARAANTVLGVADWGRSIIASGTWTQTLAAAATLGDGWYVDFRNNGSGTITIDPNGGETIDGVTTIQLAPGENCFILCNGVAFFTIGRTASDIQRQIATAFTSAGAAPAFTLTPVPAITAYAASQRFRCKFHAAGTTGSNTLNVSGLGAKSLKQYDSTGAKVAAVVAANQLADVEYDGTDFVVRDPLPIVLGVSIQGAFKNLTASADGVSSTVSAWMDEVVVKDADGVPKLLSNCALAISLATSGANGLDTGTVAASNWYSLWAIHNGTTAAAVAALCPVLTGNTTAGSAVVTGLSSTASMRAGMPVSGSNIPAGSEVKAVDSGTQITLTSKALTTVSGASLTFVYDPVMPGGYTFKARFGMCRSDGTANKYPLSFVQTGRLVAYRVAAGSNVAALPILAAGASGAPAVPTYVAVALGGVVPPVAGAVDVAVLSSPGSATTICAPNSSHGPIGSTTNPAPIAISSTTGWQGNFRARMVLESGSIYFASTAAAGNNPLTCIGWEDNI